MKTFYWTASGLNIAVMLVAELLCEEVPPGVLRDANGAPKASITVPIDAFTALDPRRVHDKEGTKLKFGLGPGVLNFTDHPGDAHRYAMRHGGEGGEHSTGVPGDAQAAW